MLLNPKSDIPLGERDIRVEDYLNDKIQTAADLGDISSLLASVELQKKQLEAQVLGLCHPLIQHMLIIHSFNMQNPN